MPESRRRKRLPEIPVIGQVDDWEPEVIRALLALPPGSECMFYIDSSGGSVYGALAVLTLLRYRRLRATALVLGECSSATLLLFAGCQRRLVTPHSVLYFHRMRWQSDKRVDAAEAYRWAKHFEELEQQIDALQRRLFGTAEKEIIEWTQTGRYVTGPELAAAGLAELIEV
jgi:ATP-dependent Clp protease protease subunit